MVANCCVGDVTGTVKLYMAENPTIDTETVEKQPWCTYDADNFVLAPCYTLDALLDLFEVSAPIDVLVIDVEGAELKVLAGASMERWKPRMIIVETHDGNPVEAFSFHAKAIREWFADKPYKLVQCDGLNSIYWRVDQ
jgi:FkbM family methyltransferase